MEEARQIVDLEAETVKIGEKQHSNWKVAQMKLKKYLEDRGKQSVLLKDFDDDEHRQLQCNTDPRKTAAIFNLEEKIIGKIVRKKM